MRRKPVLAVAVLIALSATGCLTSGYAPDATEGATAVAPTGEHLKIAVLGDSVAAGVGAGPVGTAPGDSNCVRTESSFGRRLGRMLETFAGVGSAVDVQACLGASVWSLGYQAGSIAPDTDVVFVQAGANDLGWDSALMCALKRFQFGSNCSTADALSGVERRIPTVVADLRVAIAQIRAAAPSARIVVSDYLSLFAKPGFFDFAPPCMSAIILDTQTRTLMWNLTASLNEQVRQMSVDEGVSLISLSQLGKGRSLCETDSPWYREIFYSDYRRVNGAVVWASRPSSGFFDETSYHGNHLMHAAWAKAAYTMISNSNWLGHALPSVP
ncbi:MAG: GDSL-type esterase/lipase family protein [Acidimicrobiia bacterium]